jgi:hypothetical protein
MTPYERASTDPRFRREVERHYTGGLDLFDALWWLDAPDRAAPSGAEPPWAGLEQARSRIYAPAPTQEDADRYRRLLERRDGELDRIRAAVDAALTPIGASVATAQQIPDPEPVPEPRRAPMRVRVGWVVAAVPVLLAATFGGGVLAGSSLVARPAVVPTVAPEQSPTPFRYTRPGGALGVFARPQVPEDVPFLASGTDLVPSTFRLLVPLPGPAVRLYAARTRAGDVCLVALAADSHVIASCSSLRDFRSVPRSIDISVTKDPERLDGADARNEVSASWSYDGTVIAGAV